MKTILLIILAGGLIAGAYFLGQALKNDASNDDSLGGFLTPVSKLTSSQVTCGGAVSQATTSLWTATSAMQRVVLDNLGTGNVYIAFGSNATTSSGFHLYPHSSSTAFSSRDITDPNLLPKGANCVGVATSTVNVWGY